MSDDLAPFHAPISKEIWGAKYRFQDKFTGEKYDRDVYATWGRVAAALSSVEDSPDDWYQEFYDALEDFKFLPAGRILAGAGTDRKVTLFNCYVMGTIPDSMSGIFTHLREAALTMQQGGGIGYDFSTIRPKGALVKRVGADASGPLTFMDVWDAMCRTVMSAGSRRGAMMATMSCDHPDIVDFIAAKSDPARLRMFNMSVLVTDKFMEAVKADSDWELHFEGKLYRTIRARDLWDQIMRATYAYAEPGVIFIDRINADNNLKYMEKISATNPCGEQPLPPYGACLLGSINLAALVENPYHSGCGIDSRRLRKLVHVAVRMLDNVNDVSLFPLEAQRLEAQNKRRIGLGITGLADALLMCNTRYGTIGAVERTERWMRVIALSAYEASIALAQEKGAFPLLDRAQYLSGGQFADVKLPQDLRQELSKHGIRNSHLLSIAPTGTISLFAGNVSSGIEPIFASSYIRKTLQDDGSKKEQRVVDYAIGVWEKMGYGQAETEDGLVQQLPPAYVDAQTLRPEEHVRMQAVAQNWVDTSISKTINCPEDISFEDFKAVYQLAYDNGCKGCTTYRPNDITGSVIEVEKPKAESETPKADEMEPVHIDQGSAVAHVGSIPEASVVHVGSISETPQPRPDELDGCTYKVKVNETAIYVTVTDIEDENGCRPFEVFIISQNPEHQEWTTALTRMISAIFRRPHDSRFVVSELKEVFSARGGGWWKGRYYHSTVAAIGRVIEMHMEKIGYVDPGKNRELPVSERKPGDVEEADEPPVEMLKAVCQKCYSANLKMESGCLVCLDCGHSSCG